MATDELPINDVAGGNLDKKEGLDDIKTFMSLSPTLITPALGTPDSGTLTNCDGTASSLTAGNVTTNANLTGPVTSVGNATTMAANSIDSDQYIDASIDLAHVSIGAKTEALIIAASDNTTALETGTVFTFYMPYAMTLTGIRGSVLTAPTDASLIIDVHDAGTTIMDTDKIEIDATEFESEEAGTTPTLTDTALADRAKIEIIIDQIGSTVAGAGLVVYLIGYQT